MLTAYMALGSMGSVGLAGVCCMEFFWTFLNGLCYSSLLLQNFFLLCLFVRRILTQERIGIVHKILKQSEVVLFSIRLVASWTAAGSRA